jgi:predicted kinase
LDDDGAVTVLDCIEFNERFRFADVCADVAFLFMDLEWHGRVDLAERLVAAYARESNDYELYPLVDFYASYRAFVRAKVASILARDADANQDARVAGEAEARRYYLLSLASARRSPLPQTLAAVGGIIAAGKSTVAEQVAAALAWPVVATDRIRKHLAGVDPLQPMRHPAWEGAYSPAMSELVYRETLHQADAVLASGRSVVVDGSFRTRAERNAAARTATDRGVPFLFIECRADQAVCRDRLARREARPSVSDGRLEVFDDFVAGWEPVTEIDPANHVVVDTTQPLERNVDALCRRLPGWPPGLTG